MNYQRKVEWRNLFAPLCETCSIRKYAIPSRAKINAIHSKNETIGKSLSLTPSSQSSSPSSYGEKRLNQINQHTPIRTLLDRLRYRILLIYTSCGLDIHMYIHIQRWDSWGTLYTAHKFENGYMGAQLISNVRVHAKCLSLMDILHSAIFNSHCAKCPIVTLRIV